jgi:hypothetical protein
MYSKKFPRWLIVEYAKQINKELFNNLLPIELLGIRQTTKDNDIAFYTDYEIGINYKRLGNDCEELFITLAHEFIHFYQDILKLPLNHNGKFFRFYHDKACNLYDYRSI